MTYDMRDIAPRAPRRTEKHKAGTRPALLSATARECVVRADKLQNRYFICR